MFLSTRFKFREGDPGWDDYVRFVGLPQLKEVRSLDSALNRYLDPRGSALITSPGELFEALGSVPAPADDGQYRLLFLDAEREAVPAGLRGLRLLGHDLSDETHTSSLLNCGPWSGQLAPFTQRLNRDGLLSLEDALLAKAALPLAWPNERHAIVTVWALYELP